MRKVDEVVGKPARHDPRREDSDPPPPPSPPSPTREEVEPPRPARHELATVPVNRDAIGLRERLAASEPPPAPTPPTTPTRGQSIEIPIESDPVSAPHAADAVDGTAAAPPASRDARDARDAPHAVTSADPRLEAIEPAVSAGDWAAIVKQLGADEEAGRLPPNLGLLYALARKEAEHDDATASHGSELTQLAIRCMAGLFGVPAQSPIALMLAKRILRRNPVSWQKRPAPPARVSVLFILLAVVIGGGISWAISQRYVVFNWH